MNTQKGNKLIAEFMGHWVDEEFCAFEFCKSGSFDAFDWSEVKYHESWGWLMPVIEKVESLGFYSSISGCANNHCYYCWFDQGLAYTDKTIGHIGKNSEDKIEVVWKACIKFIKFYNKEICETRKPDPKKECKHNDKRRCTYPKCECMPTKIGDSRN